MNKDCLVSHKLHVLLSSGLKIMLTKTGKNGLMVITTKNRVPLVCYLVVITGAYVVRDLNDRF